MSRRYAGLSRSISRPQKDSDLSIEANRRMHAQCIVQLPEVHPRTVRPTDLSALLLELKIHMLRAGVLLILLETACMRHPETARVLLILSFS